MILKIDNLFVSFGAIAAIRGVSIKVDRGQIVTLIGANGAGKTTLMRTIGGLLRPRGGSILYYGSNGSTSSAIDLARSPSHETVRHGVVSVPEGRGIFANLTVDENLQLGNYLRDDGEIDADREHVFTLFPRLKERFHQSAGTLSGGEQQMLAIGRGLMARPKLLLLDEPSLGLAPVLVQQIFETIVRINQSGTTILLVEQNAHMALQVASYVYCLETGTIALEGPAREMADREEVKQAYLGG